MSQAPTSLDKGETLDRFSKEQIVKVTCRPEVRSEALQEDGKVIMLGPAVLETRGTGGMRKTNK